MTSKSNCASANCICFFEEWDCGSVYKLIDRHEDVLDPSIEAILEDEALVKVLKLASKIHEAQQIILDGIAKDHEGRVCVGAIDETMEAIATLKSLIKHES